MQKVEFISPASAMPSQLIAWSALWRRLLQPGQQHDEGETAKPDLEVVNGT
jgi:hypothetical protein